MRSLLIPLFFAASLVHAQSPQLMVTAKPGEKPYPITLSKADVHVLVSGYLAETTMTLTFSNDADRVLEGELVFPLPENAAVCAYALDVGGQLVDAVTIEKEKARVVFETEVRKGIDPGIVEQIKGNNFRTRVYPIPAKGTRTIRVQYVNDLVSSQDGTISYSLPLNWSAKVKEAALKIEVVKSPVEPKIDAKGLNPMNMMKWEDRFVGEQKLNDVQLATELRVTLPNFPATSVVVEKAIRSRMSLENLDVHAAEQFQKAEYYFLVNHIPEIPAVKRAQLTVKPARIAVAWDASLSRKDVDHTRELSLLEKHIKTLGDVQVDVVAIRNTDDFVGTFQVKAGDASPVINLLKQITYDGGTNLADVEFVRQPRKVEEGDRKGLPVDVGYWLAFTDGLSNIGRDMPEHVEVPVYAVAVDPRSNHNLLRHLSTTSGGAYLNLQRLTDEEAVREIQAPEFALVSIDANPAEVTEIYPKLPQPVIGRVSVTGKLLGKEATLTLNYGTPDHIVARVPVKVSQSDAAQTSIVSRFWAQTKLAELAISPERFKSEITALGKEFNLVTPFTSMIVLERVEQYVQHKIVPPKSRPDIYSEFLKQIEGKQSIAQAEEKAKIDRVIAMWNNRVAWWSQDFRYAADFKFKGQAGGKPGAEGALPAVVAGVPTTQPANGHMVREAEALSRRAAPASPDTTAFFAQARSGGSAGGGGGRAPQPSGNNISLALGGAAQADDDYAASHDGLYAAMRSKADKDLAPLATATVAIKPWTPDTPYVKAIKAANAKDAYNVYLNERNAYTASPAFYLDCAEIFVKSNPQLAVRILTNIPELGIDDGRLLRIAAHRLQQMGELDLAIDLFEKVADLRPEEPQSFRDIALALADRAEQKVSIKKNDPLDARSDYFRALELLNKVIMNHWDRFDEIEVIALMEANCIIARVESLPAKSIPAYPLDKRLIKLLDTDLRIVMTWDTDNTDIDLHVIEPSGEECFYSHNRTTIGGAMSRDFTQGYGPEEYCLKKLMPGQYTISAQFYGSRDQKMVGPTTVQATVITHFGRPDEKRQSLTLRLSDPKDSVEIGKVTLNP